MSSISNVPYNARSMNGVIVLSDGNGTLIQNGNILTGDITGQDISSNTIQTQSFTTNDFEVTTNIDLLGNTSKLQFLFNPLQTAYIDRNSVNFDKINTQTIKATGTIDCSGNVTSYGLFPQASLNTSSKSMSIFSTDKQQYRLLTSTYNYGIGETTLRGNTTVTTNNTGTYNVAIGFEAMKQCMIANYNTVIGHNAMNQTLLSDAFYSTSNNNTIIGYNCGRSYALNRCVLLGDNIANPTTPPYKIADCCVVGSGTCKAINDIANASVFGSESCNLLSRNGLTAFGYRSFYNTTFGEESVAFGAYAGASFGGGFLGTGGTGLFIGLYAGVGINGGSPSSGSGVMCFGNQSNANGNNTTVFGHYVTYTGNDAFVIGSQNILNGTIQKLTLLNKNQIGCNQSISATGQTIALTSPENVLITDPAVTNITLPTPNSSFDFSIGATFNIIKSTGSTFSLTVNAPATQTIRDGTTTAATYVMGTGVRWATFKCIAKTGTTWQLTAVDTASATIPTLAQVLTSGNSAGTTDINMNSQSLTNVLNITTTGTAAFTGSTNYAKHLASYPQLWTFTDFTNYKTVSLGAASVLNSLTAAANHNNNVCVGDAILQSQNTTGAFQNNVIVGQNISYGLSTLTNQNITNNVFIGENICDSNSSLTGSLTNNVIIGNNNASGTSDFSSMGDCVIIGNNNSIITAGAPVSYGYVFGDGFTVGPKTFSFGSGLASVQAGMNITFGGETTTCIYSTSGTSATPVNFALFRNVSSPANNDNVTDVKFQGNRLVGGTPTTTTYGEIETVAINATSGIGRMNLKVSNSSAVATTVLQLDTASISVLQPMVLQAVYNFGQLFAIGNADVANTTLLHDVYTYNNGTTTTRTINLPVATAAMIGKICTVRRITSNTAILNLTANGAQTIIGRNVTTAAVTQAIMPVGTYSGSFCCISTTAPQWMIIT